MPRIPALAPLAAFALTVLDASNATPAPIAQPHEITVTHFDVSPPLRDMIAAAVANATGTPTAPDAAMEGFDVPSARLPVFAHEDFAGDPALQRVFGSAMPAPILNFNSIQGTGPTPPGPSADVGIGHYILMSNLRMAIYDKAGTIVGGPVNNNVLWAGFGGVCETSNSGNPWVVYDQQADRWLLTQLGSNGVSPYGICIALSVTGDPLGSYYRWHLSLGTQFPDYHRFGVWRDAYYVSARLFDNLSTYSGPGVYALNRDQMLMGNPALSVIGFIVPPTVAYEVGDGLSIADWDGQRLPPEGSPAYFVGSMDLGGPYGASQHALTLWRFHTDWAIPANSTFALTSTLPVDAFDSVFPCPGGNRRCIPQPGATTAQYLDILSYRQRFMSRATYRNFGTHESVLAVQSVEAAPSIAGLRWYELRDPGGTSFVHQSGTYAVIGDGSHRWNGSLASDQSGNIAMGYSVSSATIFPSIHYAGRLASDPLGTLLQGESVLVSGSGIQTSTANRWGDYSSMNIDPVDDCTFWYVNQYYPVTSTTGFVLRVSSFKFPNCAPMVGTGDEVATERSLLMPIALRAGPVDVRFTLAGSEPRSTRVDIIDAAGRLIRRLADEQLGGGTYARAWDRTSDVGTRVRPGVYYVRLRAGEVTDTAPAILVE